jgi:hypothetical protein
VFYQTFQGPLLNHLPVTGLWSGGIFNIVPDIQQELEGSELALLFLVLSGK